MTKQTPIKNAVKKWQSQVIRFHYHGCPVSGPTNKWVQKILIEEYGDLLQITKKNNRWVCDADKLTQINFKEVQKQKYPNWIPPPFCGDNNP